MDLDSQNFDPKRYILSMLKQNTIKELIRHNNEIDEDIKQHDQEIQSLVFENYSKFISSIDTVRRMKDNICMVDDKLKVLDSSMERISKLALQIDETFKFKRKEIQKLDTVNKDLQKLRNLCDFPNVLKQDLMEYKSISENKISQAFSNEPSLFNKSILAYEECFQTLEDLKAQPLIEPIYKQSLNKIEQIRSILRTRQVQFNKQQIHTSSLRTITKSLIIISDEQGQISILCSYFHSWKDRLIYKKKSILSQKTEKNKRYDPSYNLQEMLTQTQVPQINQQFWQEFTKEFLFIHEQLYPKLKQSEEISLLINNFTRELFTWALNNQLSEVSLYCNSMKIYVHINHIITKYLKSAISKMEGRKSSDLSREKLYLELKAKLDDKIVSVGEQMLVFVFGRLKLQFLEEVVSCKQKSVTLHSSQEMIKESYIKIMAPLKQTFKTNYQHVLNDLEHLNNSYENIYKNREEYQIAIHKQVDKLIRFITLSICQQPETVSEEFVTFINSTPKLHKHEKAYIDAIIKEYVEGEEGGCWFAVANNYLNYLGNQHGKKIIQSIQKRLELKHPYNYAPVFTFTKNHLLKNLQYVTQHYSTILSHQENAEGVFEYIHEFLELLNLIFPDSKRPVLKKPSFLRESSYSNETEIMTAKKMKIIQKGIQGERSSILGLFVRRVLKYVLMMVRTHRLRFDLQKSQVYSLVQICYEMTNVQEQSQISAFYQLLLAGSKNKPIQPQPESQASRQHLQAFYADLRSRFIETASA